MTNDKMAEDYLRNAKSKLGTLSGIFADGYYPNVVREAQECVELCLKAVLRSVGVEPAHTHDVGEILKINQDRFPGWFAKEVEGFAEISRELANDRGPSMYGDEEKGVPASELYGMDKAKQALDWAQSVYEKCERLVLAKYAK